ncbi:MAG: MerR family transcriptional regulator [Myxococcota bacterium]
MRIGEVAERAGVNVQTLRYYERRGLLDPPPRTPSGYRIYAMDTVRLVRFIKRVQELGFSLTDVEDLLRLREEALDSDNARSVIEQTRASVRERIQDLQSMESTLTHLLTDCTSVCENACDPEELLVSSVKACDIEETDGARDDA